MSQRFIGLGYGAGSGIKTTSRKCPPAKRPTRLVNLRYSAECFLSIIYLQGLQPCEKRRLPMDAGSLKVLLGSFADQQYMFSPG